MPGPKKRRLVTVIRPRAGIDPAGGGAKSARGHLVLMAASVASGCGMREGQIFHRTAMLYGRTAFSQGVSSGTASFVMANGSLSSNQPTCLSLIP